MSTETIEKPDVKTRHCPMYKVIMHDDPKTTTDFVVQVLIQFFNKELPAAFELMLEIDNKGQGLAGVYPLEHAELKVDQTHGLARTHGYPLTCTIEPA
jgi:ATP-dependent Clp protease adaptor protein ClpS